jgi:hypothetical protein
LIIIAKLLMIWSQALTFSESTKIKMKTKICLDLLRTQMGRGSNDCGCCCPKPAKILWLS